MIEDFNKLTEQEKSYEAKDRREWKDWEIVLAVFVIGSLAVIIAVNVYAWWHERQNPFR